MNTNRAATQIGSKYKISRRGRKLQVSDDLRMLAALPKDVPERTWAEILQKEENELIVLDIREELLDEALQVGYERYMEKQNALFTAHCAAQAWLKLIDWYFYRHDPGEDPSAYPPCYIPKRVESWIPDKMPDPSPKDTWSRQDLNVVEEFSEETVQRWPSSTSLDLPVVEEIPEECWFPGKVQLPKGPDDDTYNNSLDLERKRRRRSPMDQEAMSGEWDSLQDESNTPTSDLAAESELLQKVTDYSAEETSRNESMMSALKTTTPIDGSMHGAGDSMLQRKKRLSVMKGKSCSRPSIPGRSRATLAPLESQSRLSIISDCRLRNLRLDTQFEISSEKMDTPPGEVVKRKA